MWVNNRPDVGGWLCGLIRPDVGGWLCGLLIDLM